MFKSQRNRGLEGFGFYLPELDRLAHNTSEKRILALLDNKKYEGTEILFHHRWPTSTDNTQNSCHPFSTKHNQGTFDHNYVLVHNGHISNATDLKKKHEALGIQYVSVQPDGRFNDSEALLYDVALYLDGKQTELEAEGSTAFVVKNDEGKTYFARNFGSPLVYELTSRGLTVRSEGNGIQVEAHKLYEFVERSQSLIIKPLTIPTYSYHYTAPAYKPYKPISNGTGSTTWFDDETAYDTEYGTVGREAYTEALDIALSFDSTAEAIDWMEERYRKNEPILEFLQEAYDESPSNTNAVAVEAMMEEQEDIEADITSLWEVFMDEEMRVKMEEEKIVYDFSD